MIKYIKISRAENEKQQYRYFIDKNSNTKL